MIVLVSSNSGLPDANTQFTTIRVSFRAKTLPTGQMTSCKHAHGAEFVDAGKIAVLCTPLKGHDDPYVTTNI